MSEYLQSLFSLKGKTALITGARTGIGQAIAIGLAKSGAKCLLLGHQDNMQDTETQIREAGGASETVLLDLSKPELIDAFCADLLSKHRVDILVNNAGTIRRSPAVEYSQTDWNYVMNTNINSLFLLSQKLAAPMVERKEGKIINIASLLSFQGGILVPAYTASKHAVAGLTKALANEWAPHNVQVNAIAPGYIETNNTEALRQDKERSQSILARIPTGRWGTPDDLVGATVFLASPASNYMNGHILAVDGGWLAR